MMRAPLHEELTRREAQVAELIGRGLSVSQVAEGLGLQRTSALDYVYRVASKIPGDLPQRGKIMAWWRGAEITVLTGRLP